MPLTQEDTDPSHSDRREHLHPSRPAETARDGGGDDTTDLTRLSITESEKEVTTAKTGSHEVTKETSTIAYFAHGDQYLRTLSRDRRTFDPGVSTTFAKIEVEWTKAPPPQGAAAAMKQVQDIDNPCHPDYVGGEECADAAPAEPEAAPAPAE